MSEILKARPNPGRLGGIAAAARMTPEQRSARATLGGNATLQRYGIDYYSSLGRVTFTRSQKKK